VLKIKKSMNSHKILNEFYDAVCKSEIDRLTLSTININCDDLCDMIKRNKNLIYLCIRRNNFNNEELNNISKVILESNINKVDFSGSFLTDNFVNDLLDNKNIKKIVLRGSAEYLDFNKLFKKLEGNTSLESLNISNYDDNMIQVDRIENITCLINNKHLKKLYMTELNDCLDQKFAKKLSKVIKNNNILEKFVFTIENENDHMDYDDNPSNESAAIIAMALKKNINLIDFANIHNLPKCYSSNKIQKYIKRNIVLKSESFQLLLFIKYLPNSKLPLPKLLIGDMIIPYLNVVLCEKISDCNYNYN